jgi:ATP-dependent DNA helicase RecG
MVPTEILARQHFASTQELLSHYNITSDLLVGSLGAKQKKEAQARLKSGQTQVIIGTHALIQDDVHFKNLAFVIIDEQHRFGVEQRKALEQYANFQSPDKKNEAIPSAPHILHMTATPIPRTLALTIYGDQDISIIREYPIGRKPIHTKVIKEHERDQVYRFIEEEVRNGHQVFWISPLVEESETLDISSAVSMYENLLDIFPGFRIGLLHGKMKGKEKDEIMTSFLGGNIDILSSTSVVEVGVNNPNATIICMEASERF